MTDLDLVPKIKKAILAENLPLDWIRNPDGTDAALQIFLLADSAPEDRVRAEAIAANVIAHPENYPV